MNLKYQRKTYENWVVSNLLMVKTQDVTLQVQRLMLIKKNNRNYDVLQVVLIVAITIH